MHFKQKRRIPLLSLLMTGCLLLTSGCGLLGTASPPSSGSGQVGATGCLDNSKDLVNRYTTGQMSQDEWKSAFDCINQSLDFFTNYVHGSESDAYTANDMYTLVSHFLITTHPVHPELLVSAFSLKAALFGGNDQEFTKEEIALLKTSLGRLSDITGALIPYLAIRQSSTPPTYDQLIDMVTAFKTAGDQLADFINTLPVGMMSDQAFITLVNELTISLDLPTIDNLGTDVFLAKWLLFDTRRDAFENSDWAQIFKTAMGAAGVALAFETAIGTDVNAPQHQIGTRLENDYLFREFVLALANQFKPYLEQALSFHGGFAPFPIFDHIIDALPDDALNSMPKDKLKAFLRPFFRKFLFSSTQEGFDQGMIDSLYGVLTTIVQDLGLLDRFYVATGADWESVQPTVLSQQMNQYAGTLTNPLDQARFQVLKAKILNYQPQFHKTIRPDAITGLPVEHQTILFANNVGYSHFQNLLVLAVDDVARFAQKSYGTVNDAFSVADLTAFFADYTPILFALNVVDPTVPNFAPNRIRDMDLFTPVGNGDNLGQVEEVVAYAMLLISAGDMSSRMNDVITPICKQNLGIDIMGWDLLPADCFRTQFEFNLDAWISDFPRLKAYWDTKLTAKEQVQAMRWLEHGSRRDGYNEEPFGKFDMNAMATILHYTESMFMRYDFDQNEILSKAEVNSAYPVFKGILQRTAKAQGTNISGDFLLEGVFSYIVKYQTMPSTIDGKLIAWILTYFDPTTEYSADRTGIFNIVCQLAGPENPNLTQPNSVICAP